MHDIPAKSNPENPTKKPPWMMVYPGRGWRKQFMKMPLRYWRMGLGPLLQRWFLVRWKVSTLRGEPPEASGRFAPSSS